MTYNPYGLQQHSPARHPGRSTVKPIGFSGFYAMSMWLATTAVVGVISCWFGKVLWTAYDPIGIGLSLVTLGLAVITFLVSIASASASRAGLKFYAVLVVLVSMGIVFVVGQSAFGVADYSNLLGIKGS